MPRPRRVHIEEGALYLVSSKAAGNKRIFEDREDFEAYLELLEQYRMKFGFRLFAYTLLPSELHLCMQMKDGATVSSVMHALNSRYTKFYIKRHGRTDHLFEGRFKSTLMEKELYLLRMTGYLHALVERGGENANHPLTLALSPGERGKEKEYPWSSYPSYVKGEALPPMVEIHSEIQEVLKALNLEWPGISYPDYLKSVPSFRWEQFGKELEEQALGSQEFLNLVEEKGKKSEQGTGKSKPVTVTEGDSHQDSPQDPKEPKPEPQPSPMPMPMKPEQVTVTEGDSHPAPQREGTVPRLYSAALMASVLATCLALGAVGLIVRESVTVTRGDSHLDLQQEAQIAAGPRSQLQSPVSGAAALASFTEPVGLDGTSWEVRMKPLYASGGGEIRKDRLQFASNRITSAQLTDQGFSGSKYTATLKPNGVLRWETMQRSPNGQVVFWRGEWDGKTMRGVMTHRIPGSGSHDYSFVGMKHESKGTERTL